VNTACDQFIPPPMSDDATCKSGSRRIDTHSATSQSFHVRRSGGTGARSSLINLFSSKTAVWSRTGAGHG